MKTFRDLGDRSSSMAQTLNDLGGALAQAGRGAESPKLLEEAQGLARGLKSDALSASVLNHQGDASFYQGDLKAARDSYQQAQRLASHSSEKELLLIAKLNLAKAGIAEGHAAAAAGDLRNLVPQADALGAKYLSVDCSVALAEALIKSKDYAHARQELQRTLSRSEKLGLRLENARIHALMGTALRLSGSASEATAQYREALRLLDEISKEQGAEHVIERFDLKPMYAEAKQFG